VGYDLVAIGSSWGGLNALQRVLSRLPTGFAAAVVVAQHRSARADDSLLMTLLGGSTTLTVRDADDKDQLRPGLVLIAPPDYHMLIEPGTVALSCEEPVAFSRPSIDVLFESAADAYEERVVGVVLTGSNADGAAGLAAIRRRGGATIVQDPEQAERPEMPRAAVAAVPDAQVLPLEAIADKLTAIVGTTPAEAAS
jgi:two-component system, chemotaxis family, protein-glutamate methylesterase/glutaminase